MRNIDEGRRAGAGGRCIKYSFGGRWQGHFPTGEEREERERALKATSRDEEVEEEEGSSSTSEILICEPWLTE